MADVVCTVLRGSVDVDTTPPYTPPAPGPFPAADPTIFKPQPTFQRFYPGQQVTLPSDEAERLAQLGIVAILQ